MKNLNRYFLIFKMGIFLLPRNSTSCDLFYVIRQWNKCRHLPQCFLNGKNTYISNKGSN